MEKNKYNFLPARTLGTEDFEEAFGEPLSPALRAEVKKFDFRCAELDQESQARCREEIQEAISSKDFQRAGAHRIDVWERGWGENFEALKKGNPLDQALLPRYFGKHSLIIWRRRYFQPLVGDFDYHLIDIVRDWLFEKYLRSVPAICEFGCGTGRHLVAAHAFSPKAEIIGADWAEASAKLLQSMNENGVIPGAHGFVFDFFKPDYKLVLPPGAGVYTISALEQTGEKANLFVDYLLANRPAVVFHVEPIREMLDPNDECDKISLAYMEKRGYLKGFLTYLREKARSKEITILQEKRTFIGGDPFLEGYMIIAWKPVGDR